jgi:hypothetical protein
LWSGFAYTNGNSYSDGGSVGNAHSNGYINGSRVGNAHSNGDGNWCAVYPDTQTSSHAAAASIDCELAQWYRLAHRTAHFECFAGWVAGIIDAGLSNHAHFRSVALAEYRNRNSETSQESWVR